MLAVCCSGALRYVSTSCQAEKDISHDFREATVADFQPGRGHKANSRQLEMHHSTVRMTVYKWRTFKTVTVLPGVGMSESKVRVRSM